nr:hypothetical protein CFP56_44373 [Quercus suber]
MSLVELNLAINVSSIMNCACRDRWISHSELASGLWPGLESQTAVLHDYERSEGIAAASLSCCDQRCGLVHNDRDSVQLTRSVLTFLANDQVKERAVRAGFHISRVSIPPLVHEIRSTSMVVIPSALSYEELSLELAFTDLYVDEDPSSSALSSCRIWRFYYTAASPSFVQFSNCRHLCEAALRSVHSSGPILQQKNLLPQKPPALHLIMLCARSPVNSPSMLECSRCAVVP